MWGNAVRAADPAAYVILAERNRYMASRRLPGSSLSPNVWAHSAIRTVDLVSGAGKVQIKPTRLNRAIVAGYIPNELRAIAKRSEYQGIELSEMSDTEIAEFEGFKDWIIADSMVDPKVTVEWVRDEMPADDREQLFAVCTHQDLLVKLLAKFRPESAGVDSLGNGAGVP
jgi:hypothetical protein